MSNPNQRRYQIGTPENNAADGGGYRLAREGAPGVPPRGCTISVYNIKGGFARFSVDGIRRDSGGYVHDLGRGTHTVVAWTYGNLWRRTPEARMEVNLPHEGCSIVLQYELHSGSARLTLLYS